MVKANGEMLHPAVIPVSNCHDVLLPPVLKTQLDIAKICSGPAL